MNFKYRKLSSRSVRHVLYVVLLLFRCFPVDPSHSCYGLPARNSLYQYPQRLPVDDRLTNDNVVAGFNVLTSISPPPDEYCISARKHSLCIVANPPCNRTTRLLLSICSDSCLALTRIVEEGGCDSVYQYGQELFQTPAFQVRTAFSDLLKLILEFDCTNTSTYIFYDNLEMLLDPIYCTDVFTTSEKGELIIMYKQLQLHVLFVFSCT